MGALLARYYDLIHRIALRRLGRTEAAEDVAQEVCIKVGRAIGGWTGAAAFKTWLYRIALNAARDAGRRAAHDARLRMEWAREQAASTPPGSDAGAGTDGPEEQERIAALWDAVGRLSPAQAEAITLVYGEGLSHAEVAAIMGCAPATVGYHVHAGRNRLRAMMEEDVA